MFCKHPRLLLVKTMSFGFMFTLLAFLAHFVLYFWKNTKRHVGCVFNLFETENNINLDYIEYTHIVSTLVLFP